MHVAGYERSLLPEVTDGDLIRQLRQKLPGAFDRLYARYSERIWRFLHRLSGSTGMAEDLFQDTWLAAARNAHRLREDSNLLAWLFMIARNKHRNALRFVAFERQRNDGVAAVSETTVDATDEVMEARRYVADVASVFPQLATAHREVLLLCAVEGFDAAQAAKILEVREDAVRKRLSRARAQLTNLIDKDVEHLPGRKRS